MKRFFVLYFNISNEISFTPPRLLNFQEFSNLSCLFQPLPSMFSKFRRILQPPGLFQAPFLLGTQE